MFQDYRKYLTTSLKVYLFILVIIFIMKLVGLDYFGLDLDNQVVISISNFIRKNIIVNNLLLFIPLVLNQYVILSFTCDDNSKKMIEYNVLLLPIFFILQTFKINLFGSFSFLAETLYVMIMSFIYCKINKRKFKIKRFLLIMVLILVTQMISVITRFNYSIEYIQNPIANFVLNLDYIIMLLIIYTINFKKGGTSTWTDGFQEVQCSSLLKKISYSNLQKKLQKKYSQFKKLNRQEKATIIIYSILSLFWNVFTLVVVILIAKLNDTLIECLFIISSFWLSKKVFGKPFHLKSMIQCFIISNLTYYILNRITAPIGISILIPIMLGVGLSYVTSKLVKKIYKPLYKGMSEEDFESTILKVVDKNSVKYNVCYDYFISKENAIYLGRKYNYTEAGIRKITSRVNDDIKALNK